MATWIHIASDRDPQKHKANVDVLKGVTPNADPKEGPYVDQGKLITWWRHSLEHIKRAEDPAAEARAYKAISKQYACLGEHPALKQFLPKADRSCGRFFAEPKHAENEKNVSSANNRMTVGG